MTLEERVEKLEAHIIRLNECIVAVAAMANSPLGGLSCNYRIGMDETGAPAVTVYDLGASTLKRG